ncbi:hypothetical protein [Listeria booriae]|uniref:hypothetical protein n=1 Tax=Listeria booriae TaxID=1552123 RepID=UPI0016236CDB|nr:hypothetical protein [Listeria booriae]MBC1272699.1 hypothetical protein [Listeria booriae]
MSFQIAYEYDENKIFVRDSIVFPSYRYITDDGKEFDDVSEAHEHQRVLFPLREAIDLEYLNDSEKIKEGVEGEIKTDMILVEPAVMPEILTKEVFILPVNCTWTSAPNPANEAVWNGKKWTNGEMPEMTPPEPSQTDLLEIELEQAKQDNVELREIVLDFITESLE